MRRFILLCTAALLMLSLIGCSRSDTALDRDDPVVLSLWHVYGEQADSPMNRLAEEFNETEGREKGVIINVTAMTNSTAVGQKLLDARNGVVGSGEFPDLFFCHTGNAAALGADTLLDWQDWFSPEECTSFVDSFIQEGMIGEQLCVLPVSKSTHLLFLNGAQFRRFSADTGVTPEQLATWDGFFDAAEKFYTWSGGRPFCALDFLLRAVELDAASKGTPVQPDGGWYRRDDAALRESFMPFARALVQGHILISDLFSNTQVMTGEVEGGLGSSAAILYYNDTVTYSDNTTEPMELMVLPMPAAPGGTPVTTQAGVGLCASKTTPEKAEAASLFAHWLTQGERNLEFVTETGYMPVNTAAFDSIDHYSFPNENYAALYRTLNAVRKEYTALTEPDAAGYYDRVYAFYDAVRSRQKQWPAEIQQGSRIEDLSEELWELLFSV